MTPRAPDEDCQDQPNRCAPDHDKLPKLDDTSGATFPRRRASCKHRLIIGWNEVESREVDGNVNVS